MYLRFMAPGWEVRRGVDRGLFGPAYSHLSDAATPDGIARAIGHEIEWFERELPVPRRRAFCVRSKRCWRADGICWFRDDARAMIAHAHVLAALLTELGVWVTRHRTDRPGTILYRDDWQIIAKPDDATPTRWH
ncbi:hypothetical protein [Sphingomonas sp.]|uniref:hypothetical protein n=1 Tax=Sphingomonas sp. TaxID=28214 RepID=UPI001EBE8E87|nr:hypothetical protein [Sphingomonas sp.]MBX3594778.1 hypothetical protein [Sphingomonas sp.]